MALSVGDIGLNLVVNRNGFDRQMQGIQGIAKKAGVAIAAAFSVKKLVDFGSRCLELGSDLAEVQNVVDVTFPEMTGQVDKFAKGAAAAFGLSETMAKQYTGTFGAMAKAFGFTEKQAYDMGTTLTGLAGDVASFYNLSQDEAYTKLKSVFTGETESLKDLGVVMTQTALDSYALANGWGKTTAAMSETEKVALRYAFVQQQLTAAQGDFARTSDGWANQVRILKLQVDSIMATVGQGLINVLTPVIKIINTAISKLSTLANAFKALTELLTGNKSSPGEGITEAAEAAGELESATEGAGNAAEKAAKKMKGLMSFDKLNNQTDSGSGSGSASGAAGSSVDFGSLAEGADEAQAAGQQINTVLDNIKRRMEELGNLFRDGFKAGLGDSFKERISDIGKHLAGIKDSLVDIFTDPDVMAAAGKCVDKIVYASGQIAGAFTSVGITIAQNIAGGTDKYLEQNRDLIMQKLISIFDITGDIATLIGDACESLAYIFEVFGDENGQQLTANIIGIFNNTILYLLELAEKFGRDILECIIQPISDNSEALRTALDGLLGVASDIAGTILQAINETFAKTNEVYDQYLKPFFDSIAQGLSELVGTLLEVWNKYAQPLLDRISQSIQELWDAHLKPLVDNFLEVVGLIIEALTMIWENTLKPVLDWIIRVLGPSLIDFFGYLYDKFYTKILRIIDVINGIVEIIKGVLNVLLGIATGDWQRVWDGFAQVVDGVADIIKGIINSIIGIIEGVANAVVAAVNTMIRAINTIHFTVPDWVPGVGGKSIGFNLKELNRITIPKLAKGGIISSPTLAMMGENNKKEAVVPLDRNLEWRDAIADKIIEKTAAQRNPGGGLTASEARGIMMDAVNAFATLIAGLELKATVEQRDAYRAVKNEYNIQNKPKNKRWD